MADERDEDFEIEGGGSDLALRTEMAVSEFFLRHWMIIAGGLVAVVVGVGIYGTARSWYQAEQQEGSARIASVEAELPEDVLTLAQVRAGMPRRGPDGRPNPLSIDDVEVAKAGGELLALAKELRGTAAVEAALKAAEVLRLAGDATQRREALELASAGSSGVLHYAAESALGTLDLEEGRVDAAVGRFEALRKDEPFLARQATLDLAGVYETLGRTADAVATYDAWLAKWPDDAAAEDVRGRKERAALGPAPVPDDTPAPAEEPAEEPAGEEDGEPSP